MKKILFMLFVAAIGFASCTNDEISIGYNTNFKINPSTVVKPFTFEFETGELETLNYGHMIRTRLLIYNTDGMLVNEATDYLSSYATMMNTTLSLEDGQYKAVAITDVVEYTNDEVTFEYWILSDKNRLSDTKIEDAGYIGAQSKILGVKVQDIVIEAGKNNDFKIDVKPAGALYYMCVYDIHHYSSVESYQFETTKNSTGLVFDNNGDYTTLAEASDTYDWRLMVLELDDYKNNKSIYSVNFELPMNNAKYCFYAYTEDGYLKMTSDMIVSPKAGEEYLFILDLEENTYSYNLVNDGSYSPSVAPIMKGAKHVNSARKNNKVLFIKDFQ